MIYVDLHVHTRFSGDSSIDPKLVVDELYAHPVVKGVAITDHETLQGYRRAAKLAQAYEGILIIPGIEVGTPLGDLILLGVLEEPPNGLSAMELVSFAHERGGVVVAPHPFRFPGVGGHLRNLHVDAVEVFNPRASREENRMAWWVARELNLPGVAGSDAHHPSELWRAYTLIDASPDLDAVLDAIRRGRVRPIRST